MLILLGIPVVQMLLFGFAITTEVKDVQVAVFDPSKDVATRQIIEKFRASSYFDFVEELTDVDEINDIFKYGKTPFRIVPEIKMLFNPQSESAYNFVPGVMGMILMLICAMMTSIAIVREKETGTMEVLLASPMRPIFIILAKAVPYFVLSILNLITILLLSVFVLGVPVAGNIFSLMFISLVFIFLALSLGLLISTLVDTQMAAILASGMGLMMPTMILSGLVFPIESMPAVLQWISAIVPARWYIEAIRKIMIQGVGIEFVMRELGVLAVMTCLLLVLSLKKFKTRLS